MCPKLIIIMGVLLILIVPEESEESLIKSFINLAKSPNKKTIQMPPSPSPYPSTGFNYSIGRTDNFEGQREGNDIITDERCCEVSSSKPCRDLKNMTVCLSYTGNGPQGSFLIVQNDEDKSMKVNLTTLPSNIPFQEIELPKHQAKKINISAIVGASHSILLNSGNGDCVIHIGSPAPEDNSGKQIPSAITYVKPIHGSYLLALIVLVSGGACAFYKLRQRGRHLDGVPYQALEMGQPETHSAVNVETAEA